MKTFEMKTVIHFGDNSLDRLAELPYKKVLVITDPFIAKGVARSLKYSVMLCRMHR